MMSAGHNKSHQVAAETHPVAIVGVWLITVGAVTQILLAGVMILSRTFDAIVLMPLAAIVAGALLIKVVGYKIGRTLPSVLENIISIFSRFSKVLTEKLSSILYPILALKAARSQLSFAQSS